MRIPAELEPEQEQQTKPSSSEGIRAGTTGGTAKAGQSLCLSTETECSLSPIHKKKKFISASQDILGTTVQRRQQSTQLPRGTLEEVKDQRHEKHDDKKSSETSCSTHGRKDSRGSSGNPETLRGETA